MASRAREPFVNDRPPPGGSSASSSRGRGAQKSRAQAKGEEMSTVTVSKEVTSHEVVEALRSGLDPRYEVLPGMRMPRSPLFGRPRPSEPELIMVIASPMVRAQVRIIFRAGSTDLHHSGECSETCSTNTLGVAREVRQALLDAPSLDIRNPTDNGAAIVRGVTADRRIVRRVRLRVTSCRLVNAARAAASWRGRRGAQHSRSPGTQTEDRLRVSRRLVRRRCPSAASRRCI